MVHSAAGVPLPPGGLVRRAPFRAPHHTQLGRRARRWRVQPLRPGEISLAHGGVLFLDELGEFPVGVSTRCASRSRTGVMQVARANVHVDAARPVPARRRHQPVPVRWWAAGRMRVRRRATPSVPAAPLRARCSTGSTCGSASHVPTSTSCCTASGGRAVGGGRGPGRPGAPHRHRTGRRAQRRPVARRSSTRSRRSRRPPDGCCATSSSASGSPGAATTASVASLARSPISSSIRRSVVDVGHVPLALCDAFAGAGLVPRREGGVTAVPDGRRTSRRSPASGG